MALDGKTVHMDIREEETNAIYYLLRKFNLLQESINIVDSVAVTGKYGKYTWNTSTGKLDITDCEPTTNYKIIFSILNTSTKAIRTVEANSNVSSSNTVSIIIPALASNEILQTTVKVEITYPQHIQVNPYQITVTADKPIIQADETATLTAQLTHNGSAVSGKTLSYKILHGSTVIDSGSDTTNNQGKITITYTGTAIGEVDLVISYGMLLQERYELEDCIFYGLNTNAFTIPSNTTFSSNGQYITATTDTSGEKLVTLNHTLYNEDNWVFENEVAYKGTSEQLLAIIWNDNTYYGGAGYGENYVYSYMGSQTKKTHTVAIGDKFTVRRENGTTSVYINGDLIESKTVSHKSSFKVGYFINRGRTQYYKNIKLKAL